MLVIGGEATESALPKFAGRIMLVMERIARQLIIAGLSLALVLLLGCGGGGDAPPSYSTQPEDAVTTPVTAIDGETIEQAILRFFAEQAKSAMTDGDAVSRATYGNGAVAGPPVQLAEGFRTSDYLTPASWLVPHDVRAATDGMFEAMLPATPSRAYFLASIERDGHSVGEFWVGLDSQERWEWEGDTLGPGWMRRIEDASALLTQTLGEGTEVRTAIFLPSGAVLAVGSSGGQEAAVWLGTSHGPGVDGFDKVLPRMGTLYQPDEPAKLLKP